MKNKKQDIFCFPIPISLLIFHQIKNMYNNFLLIEDIMIYIKPNSSFNFKNNYKLIFILTSAVSFLANSLGCEQRDDLALSCSEDSNRPCIAQPAQPSLFDPTLVKLAEKHIKNHSFILSTKGVRKVKSLLEDLKPLVNLQIFLRADNEFLEKYIFLLPSDYETIISLGDKASNNTIKNKLTLEVIDGFSQEDLTLDSNRLLRYQQQGQIFDILKCEAFEFYHQMSSESKKQKALEIGCSAISDTNMLLKMVENFFTKHKSTIHKIESERESFNYLFRHYRINKNLKFDLILSRYPKLIQEYVDLLEQAKEAPEEKNERSKTSLTPPHTSSDESSTPRSISQKSEKKKGFGITIPRTFSK